MTAERESMTLQDDGHAPALGVEERRERGPRGRSQPRAANAGSSEVVAKPKRRQPIHRAVSTCGFWRRQRFCTQPGEVGRLLRRELSVQLPSDGMDAGRGVRGRFKA